MSENNSFDQLTDKLKKVVESRIENQIKQLEKQIEDLRSNKERDFLENETSFDPVMINDILSCVDDASVNEFYSKEIRIYFRKIRNDYIELQSESAHSHNNIGCFGGPSREARDYYSNLKSSMEYIVKNKPAEVNNFLALVILKMFAVDFKANKFYQQVATQLKEGLI